MKYTDVRFGMRVMVDNGLEAMVLDNAPADTRLVRYYEGDGMDRVDASRIAMVNLEGVWHHLLDKKQEQTRLLQENNNT